MIVANTTQVATQRPLSEYLAAAAASAMQLPYPLGHDEDGRLHMADLSKAHVLAAGATGSGKTRWLQGLIRCVTETQTPDELKLILIDLKGLDLSVFSNVPHNLVAPISEIDDVAGALAWAVREMKQRRADFKKVGACSMGALRAKDCSRAPARIVIVIDEVQIIASSSDAMASLTLLGQQGLASGIHLVVATQRPCRATLSPQLKTNFTARVSLKLPTRVDSQVALDKSGAELLGPRELIAVHGPSTTPLVTPYVGDEDLVDSRLPCNTQLPRRLAPVAEPVSPKQTARNAAAGAEHVEGYALPLRGDTEGLVYRPTYAVAHGRGRYTLVDLMSGRLLSRWGSLSFLDRLRQLTSREWDVLESVRRGSDCTTASAWKCVEKGVLAATTNGFVIPKFLQRLPRLRLRAVRETPPEAEGVISMTKALQDRIVQARLAVHRLWRPGLSQDMVLGLPYRAIQDGVVAVWQRRRPASFSTRGGT